MKLPVKILIGVAGVLGCLGIFVLYRHLVHGGAQKDRHAECRRQLWPAMEKNYADKGQALQEKNSLNDVLSQTEYTTFTVHDGKGTKVEGKAVVLLSGEGACRFEEREVP